MDIYLIKYQIFEEQKEIVLDNKESVKKFIDDRKNLVEFKKFKVYKLCTEEFLD